MFFSLPIRSASLRACFSLRLRLPTQPLNQSILGGRGFEVQLPIVFNSKSALLNLCKCFSDNPCRFNPLHMVVSVVFEQEWFNFGVLNFP